MPRCDSAEEVTPGHDINSTDKASMQISTQRLQSRRNTSCCFGLCTSCWGGLRHAMSMITQASHDMWDSNHFKVRFLKHSLPHASVLVQRVQISRGNHLASKLTKHTWRAVSLIAGCMPQELLFLSQAGLTVQCSQRRQLQL